jgi:hypothetical protein
MMSLRSVLGRSLWMGVLVLLVAVAAAQPARADVKFAFAFGVGAAPPTPAPVADSAEVTQTSTTTLDFDYTQPCGAKKLQYFTYASQIFNAFVVSNAVHRGARGVTIFGTSSSVLPYVGELALEDFIFRHFTERMSCKVRTLVQIGLSASALNNAGLTEFPK